MSNTENHHRRLPIEAAIGAAVLAAMAIGSYSNYLVFHSLVEVAGIAVAVAAFAIAWNVRRRMNNDFLLFVALSYAAAAVIDLVHALAYKGMNVFPWATTNLPTQLWIASRSLQAPCLLLAPLLLNRKLNVSAAVLAMAAADALLLTWIFHPWPWLPQFPVCHDGELTSFKIISEYVISGVMLAAAVFLWFRRDRLDKTVFRCMAGAFLFTTAAELAFTSYVSVYGPANMIGHLLKLAGVFLIYKALVQAGLTRPFDVLFRDLSLAKERLEMAQQAGRIGTFEWDLRHREVFWTDGMEEIYGIKTDGRTATYQTWIQRLHPDDAARVEQEVEASLAGVTPLDTEYRIVMPDGSIRWICARGRPHVDDRGRAMRMVGINMDITPARKAQEEIQRTAAELKRSNHELEHFASVASHDLQEPLRAVTGFLELLKNRYHEKRDAKANEYINFSFNGARRMQQLISDLLAYARVGTQGLERQAVNAREPLDRALANLRMGIQESAAKITCDELPSVAADRSQMTQLFQNLIGNALKFRGPQPPEIRIGARRQDGAWVFFVSDNGIGIDPQQSQRIFEVFQRLHSREQYPGSGIGLAICKKIVDQHGGRIWVDSLPGQGATFSFTIPDALPSPAEPS